ncbi:biotin/lipoyl-containing protein, partial [Burkholderia seminalis]
MGIHVIKMPDIGEGIAEVELVAWHVAVGQTIKEDQPLADVMTDKAAVEIPSPVTGKVIELGGRIGEMMAVGSELIRLEVEGDGNLKAGAPVRETKVATAPVAAAPAKPAVDVPAEPPARPTASDAPARPRRDAPA